MIIADTDVLIDFGLGIKLLSGAEENKRGQVLRQLLDSITVLPLDRDAARRAAEVRR